MAISQNVNAAMPSSLDSDSDSIPGDEHSEGHLNRQFTDPAPAPHQGGAFAAARKKLVSCAGALMVPGRFSIKANRKPLGEIDKAMGQELSDDVLHGAVRSVTSDCDFCVSIADPRTEDNVLIAVSPAFEKMTGYSASEVVGRNCRFMNEGCKIASWQRSGLRIASTRGIQFTSVLNNRKKSGEHFLNLLDMRGLVVASNRQTGENLWLLVGIQTDVTDHILSGNETEITMRHFAQLARRIRKKLLNQFAEMGLSAALGPMEGGWEVEPKWFPSGSVTAGTYKQVSWYIKKNIEFMPGRPISSVDDHAEFMEQQDDCKLDQKISTHDGLPPISKNATNAGASMTVSDHDSSQTVLQTVAEQHEDDIVPAPMGDTVHSEHLRGCFWASIAVLSVSIAVVAFSRSRRATHRTT